MVVDGLPAWYVAIMNVQVAPAQAAGKQYYHLRIFDLDTIGTDPKDAVNFAERTVEAGKCRERGNVTERSPQSWWQQIHDSLLIEMRSS